MSDMVEPARRGATYTDEFLMIHADTGATVPFLPAIDTLTWRLFNTSPQGGCYGPWPYGADYGFAPNPAAALNDTAVMTLQLGQGLFITPAGTALWVVPNWPYWLRRPEYRMTLDLVRYGETCRVLDAILPVER